MKAIVIGATGLVGNLILNKILNDDKFSEVRIFVRNPTGIINPKLKEFVTPMKDIEALSSEIKGDVLFNFSFQTGVSGWKTERIQIL